MARVLGGLAVPFLVRRWRLWRRRCSSCLTSS